VKSFSYPVTVYGLRLLLVTVYGSRFTAFSLLPRRGAFYPRAFVNSRLSDGRPPVTLYLLRQPTQEIRSL